MIANRLLSRLEHVRPTGEGSWMARCPAHDDHDPSLSIREAEEKVLIHCFAGCASGDILASVGLEWDDLFPPRTVESESMIRPRTPQFPWGAFLQSVKRSLMTVTIGAAHVARGNSLTQSELEVLIQTATDLYEAIQTVESVESGKMWSGKTWK